MQHLVFEADTKESLQEVADRLWSQHNVSGEFQLRPAGNHKWRLDIHAERDVRDATLEKFATYRVKAD